MSGQRYRFERVEEHGGRRIAVIRDKLARPGEDELVRVYYRGGRWRRWEARYGDDGCGQVLASVARRGLGSGLQDRIGEEPLETEELAPAPTAEKVRLFDPAPEVTPGQLTIDTTGGSTQ